MPRGTARRHPGAALGLPRGTACHRQGAPRTPGATRRVPLGAGEGTPLFSQHAALPEYTTHNHGHPRIFLSEEGSDANPARTTRAPSKAGADAPMQSWREIGVARLFSRGLCPEAPPTQPRQHPATSRKTSHNHRRKHATDTRAVYRRVITVDAAIQARKQSRALNLVTKIAGYLRNRFNRSFGVVVAVLDPGRKVRPGSRWVIPQVHDASIFHI